MRKRSENKGMVTDVVYDAAGKRFETAAVEHPFLSYALQVAGEPVQQSDNQNPRESSPGADHTQAAEISHRPPKLRRSLGR